MATNPEEDKKKDQRPVTENGGAVYTADELTDEEIADAYDDQYQADREAEEAEEARRQVELMYGPEDRYVTQFTTPEPKKSDYELNNEFVKQYFPNVITPEEEDRRAKAATRSGMFTNFGNAAAALGNVINVGKGAVSQTVPEVKAPDITTWRRGMQGERQKVGTYRQQLHNDYLKARQAWETQRMATETQNTKFRKSYGDAIANVRKSIMADRQKEDALALQRWKTEFTAEERAKLTKENNGTRLKVAQMRKSSGGSHGGGSKSKGGRSSGDDIAYAWANLPEDKKTRGRNGSAPSKGTMIDDLVRAKKSGGGTTKGKTHNL